MTGALQKYLLAGVLTVIPIWVTWFVFELIVSQLSGFGRPWVVALSSLVRRYQPALADALLQPWFQNAAALVLTLLGLVLLGWVATRVVGRKLLAALDRLIQRIPLVEKIYGASKTLISALQQQPGHHVQRVVLIAFPSPEMKTVGFITRVLTDPDTGEALAAVYVPTTPNPTSGYLEIVPLDQVVPTDWTLDQAMSFVISGGTVAPEQIHYRRGKGNPARGPERPVPDAPAD